ncbi:MAG TPA: LLM class flavin-dependent oxidoreductase, partial [Acidimicrobiia bacterium]|nr:LLM class flavin-dependent oxidoreductase [Acidimicrobiia bacterium]
MRFGVALPQYGPAIAEGLTTAARQAEDLGFDDVWVADHIAVPVGAPYPPSFLLEALATLSFAAAVTTRIGLGTSVLVLPLRQPVVAAKQVATLDVLSGGRLTLGLGAGWLREEFEA